MNRTEIKKKKKPSLEKKNPASHKRWLDYKKTRNQEQYKERKIKFEFTKIDDNKYLTKCAFCLQKKIEANEGFYIHNRNKVAFWKTDLNSKLVCFDCLFSWKEIDIDEVRRDIFKTYKSRYFKKENLSENYGSN